MKGSDIGKTMKKRFVLIPALLGTLALGFLAVNYLQSNSVQADGSTSNYSISILRKEYAGQFQSEAEIDDYFKDYPDDTRILAEEGGGYTGTLPQGQSKDATVQHGDGEEVSIHDSRSATIGQLKAVLKEDLK